jgi:hypothetical protein
VRDWSSDVCSSDLFEQPIAGGVPVGVVEHRLIQHRAVGAADRHDRLTHVLARPRTVKQAVHERRDLLEHPLSAPGFPRLVPDSRDERLMVKPMIASAATASTTARYWVWG